MVSMGQASAWSLAVCFWLRVSQEAVIKVSAGVAGNSVPILYMWLLVDGLKSFLALGQRQFFVTKTSP